jgi:hypothetical protein
MIKKLLAYTLWGVLLLIFFILFKAYAHQPTFQETGNTDDIMRNLIMKNLKNFFHGLKKNIY